MTARTALQINMHPLDARHVAYTLEHQLGVWSGQVDRISLTVDSKRSRSGRYRGSDYEENRDRLYGSPTFQVGSLRSSLPAIM